MATLDDLHLAMGCFLTESSQAENVMFSIYHVCAPSGSLDGLFNEFMDQTLGTNIRMVKAASNGYPFCDEHRVILVDAYSDLDALLPKRNFIVHGFNASRSERTTSLPSPTGSVSVRMIIT